MSNHELRRPRIEAPEPGLYPGVPFDTYADWDAVNWSRLKDMAKTPAHFKWGWDHLGPPETPDQAKGRLIHVAVLEPDQLAERYLIQPNNYPTIEKTGGETVTIKQVSDDGTEYLLACGRGSSRQEQPVVLTMDDEHNWQLSPQGAIAPELIERVQVVEKPWTNAAKFCSSWRADSDATIIKLDQFEQAHAMAKAVRGIPDARSALDGARCELCVVWDDPQTGIRCKARLDAERLGQITDLKTTAHGADWESFAKTLCFWGYAGQAAMYREGLDHALAAAGFDRPDPATVRMIVVEDKPPYAAAVYDLIDDPQTQSWAWLEHGRVKFHSHIQALKYCRDNDWWPAYNVGPDGVTEAMELEVPDYLQGRILEGAVIQ